MKKCLKQLVVYSFTSILVKCHYHPLITKKSKKWFIIYCLLLIPLTSKFLKFEKWFKVENSPNDFNILNVFYIFWRFFTIFILVGSARNRSPSPSLQACTGWDASLASLAPSLRSSTSSIWIRPYCPELKQQRVAARAHFFPKKM